MKDRLVRKKVWIASFPEENAIVLVYFFEPGRDRKRK